MIIFIMGGLAYGFFKIQSLFFKDKTIRSSEADEIAGLDRPEMGVLAYDNLQIREIDVVGMDPSEDKVLATRRRVTGSDDGTVTAVIALTSPQTARAGGHSDVPTGSAASVHIPETLPRREGNSPR